MSFYDTYVSNTLAGSSNQTYFESDGELKRARVYYKILCGGKHEYSLLYSNITDSTYGDRSKNDTPLEGFEIEYIKAGICKESCMETAVEPEYFTDIYFDGNKSKKVGKGDLFWCDPFVFEAERGEFMCIEIAFRGEKIPCHEELWIASFVEENGVMIPSSKLPVPLMVGVKRDVDLKITFLGDSITQGIGSTKNSYNHWSAKVSESLGTNNSYWNLGIGCAKSIDAAYDGAWLDRAKHNDIAIVCLGVNDILTGESEEVIKNSLKKIIQTLTDCSVKVIIQTVPPFDYDENNTKKWLRINEYIKGELAGLAFGCFDVVPYLCKNKEEPQFTAYGAHPNDEGSSEWAKALSGYLKFILKEKRDC